MTPHPSFPTTPSGTGQRQEANGLGGDFGILALGEGRNMSLIPSESTLHRALKKKRIHRLNRYPKKTKKVCCTVVLWYLFFCSHRFEVPSPKADIMELRPERSPLLSCMTTCSWFLCLGVGDLQCSAGWQRNKQLTKFLSGLVRCLFLFPRLIQDSFTEVICCRSCLKESDVLHSAKTSCTRSVFESLAPGVSYHNNWLVPSLPEFGKCVSWKKSHVHWWILAFNQAPNPISTSFIKIKSRKFGIKCKRCVEFCMSQKIPIEHEQVIKMMSV